MKPLDLPKKLSLMFANMVSAMTVLWSSRAFYFHANLAGWGDAAVDKKQYFLWWARLISVIVFGAFVLLSAAYSSRYRWSVVGGTAITALLWWARGFSIAKWLGSLLLIGWFIAAFGFGVHAEMHGLTAPFCWMLGINTALYACIIAVVWPPHKEKLAARS